MANTPKKMQDPTEAALSAIQDALNLREGEPAPAGAAPAIEPEEPRENRRRRAPVDQDLFMESAPIAAQEPMVEEPRGAANDDRQAVGQMLQTLQGRRSINPYLGATLFSVVWGGIGLALAIGFFGADFGNLFSRAAAPQLFGILGAIVVPIAFFFVLAHMVRRAQELRVIARSMTDVSMRLAEPETIAREAMVTVGQAIRREVAAMGDGVERALARAAELEALVHNEVAQLERAYNYNELRIRGLIEDLANQRDTLVAQAEQVRNSLASVHLGLTQDITSISEMVAASVNDAASRITRTLAEKGEHITLALGRAGDSMIDAIGERGGDLLDHLNRTGDDVSRTLETASDKMTASLNVKTDHISEQVEELTVRLAQMLS